MKVKNEYVFILIQSGIFERMRSLKLPMADAYNILKVIDAVTPVIKRIEAARSDILKEIGVVADVKPTSEQEALYAQKFQELLNIEDDIETEKIPLSMLVNAKMECSAAEIKAIEWLINMEA